jgi:hypothetical protein
LLDCGKTTKNIGGGKLSERPLLEHDASTRIATRKDTAAGATLRTDRDLHRALTDCGGHHLNLTTTRKGQGMKTIMYMLAVLACLAVPAAASAVEPMPPVTVTDTQVLPDGTVATLTGTVIESTVDAQAGCGQTTYQYRIKAINPYHLYTYFTYESVAGWYWCNFKVTRVHTLVDRSVDSCCGWGWRGNQERWTTAVGGANVVMYNKGKYVLCALFCIHDYHPWIQLRGNGNGLITGTWWGLN